MNQTTKSITPLNASTAPLGCRQTPWLGRGQAQGTVRTVSIVVIDEHGQGSPKMFLIQNQEPVETFGAGGPHKPLGCAVRLGRPKWRANNLDTIAVKDRIETFGELLVPIAYAQRRFSLTSSRSTRRRPW